MGAWIEGGCDGLYTGRCRRFDHGADECFGRVPAQKRQGRAIRSSPRSQSLALGYLLLSLARDPVLGQMFRSLNEDPARGMGAAARRRTCLAGPCSEEARRRRDPAAPVPLAGTSRLQLPAVQRGARPGRRCGRLRELAGLPQRRQGRAPMTFKTPRIRTFAPGKPSCLERL